MTIHIILYQNILMQQIDKKKKMSEGYLFILEETDCTAFLNKSKSSTVNLTWRNAVMNLTEYNKWGSLEGKVRSTSVRLENDSLQRWVGSGSREKNWGRNRVWGRNQLLVRKRLKTKLDLSEMWVVFLTEPMNFGGLCLLLGFSLKDLPSGCKGSHLT